MPQDVSTVAALVILLSAGVAIVYASWRATAYLTTVITTPLIRRIFFLRSEVRAIERGEKDLMTTMALYRERVVDKLSQREVLGQLSAFSLDKMYVPLELELRQGSVEPIKYGKPEEFVRSHTRLAILGSPGAGKTTLLHYLELRTAQGRIPGVPDLPLFIPVSQLSESGKNVVAHAVELLRERYRLVLREEQLISLLEAGLILMLIDGLDEAGPGSDVHSSVIEKINDLSRKYPATSIVVSCRTAVWANSLPDFHTVTIPALNQDAIRRFIVARLPSDAGEVVETLLRSINTSRSLGELARVPLFLSLIIALYSNVGEMPRNRLQLYQQCTDLMLYHWDKLRGVTRPSRVPYHLKYQLLKRLGLYFQRQHVTAMAIDDLADAVAEWFSPATYGPPESIISELEEAHGVLVHTGMRNMAFWHITFQQYFAALEISDGRPLPNYLTHEILSPWWMEVVLLLSALGSADEMVQEILEIREDGASRGYSAKLQLAAQCVRESPQLSPNLRQEVVSQLQKAFELGDDRQSILESALALGGIGGRVAESFLEQKLSSDTRSEERLAAALALTEFGRPQSDAIDILLESLQNNDEETRARVVRALGQAEPIYSLEALLRSLSEDDSAQVRAEAVRAVNRITQVPSLETDMLALTIKGIRKARSDSDPTVSSLASEILGRLSAKVQE